MSEEASLIVGAGVVGLCAALYALRRGFAVTVVERDAPARRLLVRQLRHDRAQPLRAARRAGRDVARPEVDARSARRRSTSSRGRRSSSCRGCVRFARRRHRAHVARAAPLLRDLCLASRECYEELAAQPDATSAS